MRQFSHCHRKRDATESCNPKGATWVTPTTLSRVVIHHLQCAETAAPVGGLFIRNTNGMTTRAAIAKTQKLSR